MEFVSNSFPEEKVDGFVEVASEHEYTTRGEKRCGFQKKEVHGMAPKHISGLDQNKGGWIRTKERVRQVSY